MPSLAAACRGAACRLRGGDPKMARGPGRVIPACREIERALDEAEPGTAVYNELSKTRAEILTKAGF